MLTWTLALALALGAPEPTPDPVSDPLPVADEEVEDAPPWTHATPAEITVESEGDRPRRKLGLRPTDGDRWQLQIQRQHAITVEGEPHQGVTSTLATHVELDSGEIRVVPVDIALSGAPPEGLAAALDGVRRVAEQAPPAGTIDPQQTQRVDADPTGLDPLSAELVRDLVWTLQATAVPLPEVRVGPGARWSWGDRMAMDDATIDQRWTATLVRADRHAIVVDLSLKVTGDASATDAALEGSGRVWMRRDRPLARAAELTLHATMVHRPPASQSAGGEDTDVSGDPPLPQDPVEATLEARITIATREVPASEPSDG